MRRAGVLTGGLGALMLLALVCIPQHPFPLSMTSQSIDHDRPSFNRVSLHTGDANQAFDLHQPSNDRPKE
ncbi:MAG: hypothetical protein MRJ66_05305 [Nitrospira sp.]|nr:hypothetical protein [Nitrospira sp.]